MLIALANLAVFGSLQSLAPTVPLYVAQLGGNPFSMGLASGAMVFSAILVRPWMGRLVDQRGRKRVLVVCLAIFLAAGLLYPWAASIPLLVGIRLLQGVGWGGSLPAAGAFVADVLPARRRGEGMGYYGLSTNLAMALAPPAALAVMRLAGFSAVAWMAAALTAVALGLAMGLREPVRSNPLGARASGLPDDNGAGGTLAHPPARAGGESAPATGALGPSIVMGLITFTFGGLATFIAVDAAARGWGDASAFFVTFAVVLMATRPLAGALSDRRRRGLLLIPGIVLMCGGLALIGAVSTWWMPFGVALLYGLGMGSVQPALQAMVVDKVPPEGRGTAMATFFTAFDLGIGLGSVLLGALASLVGVPAMFLVTAGLALLALIPVGLLRLYR